MQEKVLGPATVIDFLGFVIDTVSMEIRLPTEKLSRIKQLIHSWRSKKSCIKRASLADWQFAARQLSGEARSYLPTP